MKFTRIEILNNHTTRMEHVAELLSVAFAISDEYAFDVMLNIHQGRSPKVFVFDAQESERIVTRFRTLNGMLPEPIKFLVDECDTSDDAIFINVSGISENFPEEFPSRSNLLLPWVVGVVLCAFVGCFWFLSKSGS